MSEEKTAAFRELCKLTGQAVSRYRMIGEGDRILVGLSGGKDSFMLLHALHALRRKAPVRFDLIAATFDPGFPEFNVAGIADYCRRQGWEHRVVKLDIAGILAEKRYEGTPCVLCSRLRRGKLYGLAAAEGCGKLALGQHFDDIAASFLMSLFRGQGLSTMGPNVAAKAKEGIRIIRPFVLAPESLILRPVTAEECRRAAGEIFDRLLAAQHEGADCFVVKSRDERIRVPYRKILYFEARERRLCLRMAGEELTFTGTLEKLLETLPPEFRRVHRSFVVNADNIQRVVLSQNLVYLRGDVAVPLSRSYKKEVREYDA